MMESWEIIKVMSQGFGGRREGVNPECDRRRMGIVWRKRK